MGWRNWIPVRKKTTSYTALNGTPVTLAIRELYVALGVAIGDEDIKQETRFYLGTTHADGFFFELGKSASMTPASAASAFYPGAEDFAMMLDGNTHISIFTGGDAAVVKLHLCK